MEFFAELRELNLISITLRMLLAVIIGGFLGFERGMRNRPGGFKTHMLVCVGATVTMLTSQYIFTFIDSASDISRLGAQVISGIGFLGVGTIIVTSRNQVQGLSTAAGIWATATLGLAVGIGFYEGAIIGFLFLLIIITVFYRFDSKIYSNSKVIYVYVELDNVSHINQIISYCEINSLKINHLDVSNEKTFNDNVLGLSVTISCANYRPHEKIISEIRELEGVCFAEEIARVL